MSKQQQPAPSDNITNSLKPTSRTASFVIFICSALATLLLPVFYPNFCNYWMTPEDALRAKALFYDNANHIMPLLVGVSGGGVVGQSVAKTLGKVIAQLFPGMTTEATPSGEGIGSPSSANLTQAATEAATSAAVTAAQQAAKAHLDDLIAKSGFDARDFNIGAPTPEQPSPIASPDPIERWDVGDLPATAEPFAAGATA